MAERSGARRGAVLGLSAVLCLTLLPTASYAAALPLIQDEWGLSMAEAGFIFSAYQVGYVAATLILLPLTDRVDARRVVIASTVLSAVGNALFPLWAADFVSGTALRFLAGLALVGVYMPGLRIVAEAFPGGRRGGPVGVYVSAFYLGASLSVLVTGLLLPLGWRMAYLATSGLAAVAPLVAWASLRHLATAPATRSGGHLSPQVLRNRPALLTIGAYAAHTWELYAARAWVPPFLAAVLVGQGYAAGEAVATGATVAGTAFGLGTLGVACAGFLSDRYGRTATAGLCLAGSALCSLSLGWLGGAPWWALLAAVTLYGLLIGPDSPVYSTAVTELARPGQLGSTMAVQSFIGFLTSIVGPVATGFVLDVAPRPWGWGVGFAVSGVVALLGVAALVALRRHQASARLAGGRR